MDIIGRIGKGIIAGFIATVALSLVVDPIASLARTLWASSSSATAWLLHFFVGTLVWGSAFALLHDHMSGPSWLRGIVFASGAWLMVMLVAMPLAGAGLFASELGLAAVAATLIIHAIYGAVLGGIYGEIVNRDGDPTPRDCGREDKRLHPLVR